MKTKLINIVLYGTGVISLVSLNLTLVCKISRQNYDKTASVSGGKEEMPGTTVLVNFFIKVLRTSVTKAWISLAKHSQARRQ